MKIPSVGMVSFAWGPMGPYPPNDCTDNGREIADFEQELSDESCRRADLRCTWVTNDWNSIVPNLVNGRYDTIIASEQ